MWHVYVYMTNDLTFDFLPCCKNLDFYCVTGYIFVFGVFKKKNTQ